LRTFQVFDNYHKRTWKALHLKTSSGKTGQIFFLISKIDFYVKGDELCSVYTIY